MKNKKGNIAVIAVIIAIVAISAGIMGWMFAKKSQAPFQQQAVATPTVAPPLPAAHVGWKTVTGKYFEIKAPGDWEESCAAGGCILNADISKSTTDETAILRRKTENKHLFLNLFFQKTYIIQKERTLSNLKLT